MESGQLVNFFYSIVVGGTTTSVLTELFKLPIVPIAAKKYPRLTASVLSFLSALIAVLLQGTLNIQHWVQVVGTAAGTFLIAVMTFKTALKGLQTNVIPQKTVTQINVMSPDSDDLQS